MAAYRRHPRTFIAPAEEPRSQHFLRDPRVARRIVRDAALAEGALVLDIGAGTGVFTRALVDASCRVVAIEKDARLFRSLRSRFVGRTNVECHHADALTFPLPREPYAVVANVPFGISAGLVRRLIEAPNPPSDAWLILQREAAQKYAGISRETMFSLLAKPSFEVRVVRSFARTDFSPAPSVESVLLHMHERAQPLVRRVSMPAWRAFVRDGYRSGASEARRALRAYLTRTQFHRLAREHRFDLRARPSELTFAQWLALFRFYDGFQRGRDPTMAALLHDPTRSPIMTASAPRSGPTLHAQRRGAP